jgi:hypothetical protein
MNSKETKSHQLWKRSSRFNNISNKAMYPELFDEEQLPGEPNSRAELNYISLEKFESVEATAYQAGLLFSVTRDIAAKFEKEDPSCKDKTTAEALWSMLEKLVKLLFVVSQSSQDEHCQLFQVIYNTSSNIYRLVKLLKQFWHSQKLSEVLTLALKAIDSCPILLRPKYLEWKLKLHLGEMIRGDSVRGGGTRLRHGQCLAEGGAEAVRRPQGQSGARSDPQ